MAVYMQVMDGILYSLFDHSDYIQIGPHEHTFIFINNVGYLTTHISLDWLALLVCNKLS
jgi:inner membrane protein involved in colicin E2 resistance